jgi:heme/copper-type cytochrome/quinol oxidase subunit 4
MLGGWVSSVFNNTPARKLNRVTREDREKFDAAYAVLLNRRNSIVQRANQSLLRIRDNSTIKQLNSLDDTLSQIAELGDNRDYNAAYNLSKNFSLMADAADSQVSGLETTYNQLLANNESASDALFKAWLYLEPQDFVLNDRLELLNTQKASLEFTIYNNSPLSLTQANQLSDQLLNIQLNASDIVNAKSSATSNQMNSLVSIIAKPAVSFSLSVINSVIPLSYADKEKNTSTIIAAILIIMDFIIILITLLAFFYFVRSKRIELHRVAKIAWAFIFAFFLLLLALSTLAIYNVADLQSHPTNFGPFLSELKSSQKVGVVAELTGLNATMKGKMTNCSERIASKLTSLNKSVMDFRYDGDNCFIGNLTQSKVACDNDIDANPVIILRSGQEDKATFNVFYTKKAILEGRDTFFEDCIITKTLE